MPARSSWRRGDSGDQQNRGLADSIALPTAASRYTLTAQKLEDVQVELNGHVLKLAANGELPSLEGTPISSGHVELPAASITFLAVGDVKNGSSQ